MKFFSQKICTIGKYALTLHRKSKGTTPKQERRGFLSKSIDNLNFGALVQLVRMPACHAGGHGFESRTHRQRREENE